MSDDAGCKYDKSLDYATVYADDAIVELDDDVCRIIFYQNAIEPTPNGTGLEHPIIKLKHEVRLPERAFRLLCNYGKGAKDLLDRAYTETENVQDQAIIKKLNDLEDEIKNTLFDTGDINYNRINQLEDKFEDVVGRALREKKHEPL